MKLLVCLVRHLLWMERWYRWVKDKWKSYWQKEYKKKCIIIAHMCRTLSAVSYCEIFSWMHMEHCTCYYYESVVESRTLKSMHLEWVKEKEKHIMRNCNKFSKRQILLEFGTCRLELYFSFVLLIFFLSFVIHLAFLVRSWKYKGRGNRKWIGSWSIHTSEGPVSTLCSFFRHPHATHTDTHINLGLFIYLEDRMLVGLDTQIYTYSIVKLFCSADVRFTGKSNAVVPSHGSSERLLCMPFFPIIFHYIRWDVGNIF